MPASTEAEISSFYQSIPILTEARSIRVLDVQSAPSANGDGPIQGTLRSVELDKRTNFYALSYVCGTPATGEHLVGCGETLLAVTENCYLALKFLYLKLGRFTIWVDAVCIHQQDGTEKARQIAVMGEVFSNASTVYVWLGLETYRKRIAMRFLSEILLLKFLTVDGTVDGTEFNTPKYWAAFWSFYRSQWLLGGLRCWSRVSKAIPWAALGPSETAQRGTIAFPWLNVGFHSQRWLIDAENQVTPAGTTLAFRIYCRLHGQSGSGHTRRSWQHGPLLWYVAPFT